MSDTIDYAAEVRRTRQAQGLPAEIPPHLREAVEALLAANPTRLPALVVDLDSTSRSASARRSHPTSTTDQQHGSFGAPCLGVIAGVGPATRIKYQQDCDEHADELLATARRIAELRNYGQNEATS